MVAINANLQGLPIDENAKGLQGTFRSVASGTGTVTTSGTAVQIKSTPTQAKVIDIINPTSNGDVIVIGASNVSFLGNIGIPIEPGFTYRLQVTDLSLIWVDSAANGYKFQYNWMW